MGANWFTFLHSYSFSLLYYQANREKASLFFHTLLFPFGRPPLSVVPNVELKIYIYSSFLLPFKPNKWNLNSYLFYIHLLSTSKHINGKTSSFPFPFSSLSLFISFSFSPSATKNSIKVSTPRLLPPTTHVDS